MSCHFHLYTETNGFLFSAVYTMPHARMYPDQLRRYDYLFPARVVSEISSRHQKGSLMILLRPNTVFNLCRLNAYGLS